MTKDFIARIVKSLAPNCHEGERDKVIDWIWEHIVSDEDKES